MKASRFGSVAIRVMFASLTPLMVVALLCGAWSCFRDGQEIAVVFLVGLLFCWFGLTDFALRDGPLVHLTEEGVWVRCVLRRRFYPWAEILQAGIVYRPTYRGDRNWPCLLLPGGSPRKGKDRTFVYRNYGRIVWIDNSPKVLDYVTAHYGPLDFDLSK